MAKSEQRKPLAWCLLNIPLKTGSFRKNEDSFASIKNRVVPKPVSLGAHIRTQSENEEQNESGCPFQIFNTTYNICNYIVTC